MDLRKIKPIKSKVSKTYKRPQFGVINYSSNCSFPNKATHKVRFQNFVTQNHEEESHTIAETTLRNTIDELSSTTTLHGFQYLFNKKYSRLERLWWLVMIVCSAIVSSYFIKKVWQKWNATPVVVKKADFSTSVWEIPFPAVTVCIETKSRQREFNFTKAFNERWSNQSTINAEDLKLYHDMLLVCDNLRGDGPDFADINSIEILRKLAPSRNDIFFKCKWGTYICDDLFFQTLTKDGYCFTFNMFSAEDMFHMENLHNDYAHIKTHVKSTWSLSDGYMLNAPVDTFPFRGKSQGLDVILITDLRDMDERCSGAVQGFKIWLHNPAELPNMGQNFFRLPIKYHSNMMITPRLTDTNSELQSYTPKKRGCYFSHERRLRFFRTYTKKNCELECASNYTARRCHCVPLYMPHSPNTKICGGGKAHCIIKAFEELSISRSGLDKKASKEVNSCTCLQACTELKYETKVSHAVYDVEIFENIYNSNITREGKLPSGFIINFSKVKAKALRRSQLYETVEFLANCGGIMGLFIGLSILSFMEIVFYLTLRLWCVVRSKK